MATDDPQFNTSEPSGALAGSGWQWQGRWGDFLGTAISSNLFVTAKHVGGQVGDVFTYRGRAYHTHARFDDPESDLHVWLVCGVFPDWAPLYPGSDESGKAAVVIGRGTRRGLEVRVTGGVGGELKGWQWGDGDGVMRWGENTVASIVSGSGAPVPPGAQAASGFLLKFTFDAHGGPNEAMLSGGDSGGAAFIKDGDVWKLAGIHYAVDGPYNASPSGSGFNAALFDTGGLYLGGEGQWQLQADQVVNRPGAFYSTRISARISWLSSVIANASGQSPVPELESAPSPAGPWQPLTPLRRNPDEQSLYVGASPGMQFFRLRHCSPLRLVPLGLGDGEFHMRYEDDPTSPH